MANRKKKKNPKKEPSVKKSGIAKKSTAETRRSARIVEGRISDMISGSNHQPQRPGRVNTTQQRKTRLREDDSDDAERSVLPDPKKLRLDADFLRDDSDVEFIELPPVQVVTIELSDDEEQQSSGSNETDKLKVTGACKIAFENIRKSRKHRYVIFNVRNQRIVVEKIGDRNASYDQYLKDLQKASPLECRFGLFDYEYEHQRKGLTQSIKMEKMFLMFWCPETATKETQVMYDNSFVLLRDSLAGIQKFFYVTEWSDASVDSIEKRLRADDR